MAKKKFKWDARYLQKRKPRPSIDERKKTIELKPHRRSAGDVIKFCEDYDGLTLEHHLRTKKLEVGTLVEYLYFSEYRNHYLSQENVVKLFQGLLIDASQEMLVENKDAFLDCARHYYRRFHTGDRHKKQPEPDPALLQELWLTASVELLCSKLIYWSTLWGYITEGSERKRKRNAKMLGKRLGWYKRAAKFDYKARVNEWAYDAHSIKLIPYPQTFLEVINDAGGWGLHRGSSLKAIAGMQQWLILRNKLDVKTACAFNIFYKVRQYDTVVWTLL